MFSMALKTADYILQWKPLGELIQSACDLHNVDLQCRFYKVDSPYSTLAVDFVAQFNTPDPPKIESGSPLNELDLVEPLTMAS